MHANPTDKEVERWYAAFDELTGFEATTPAGRRDIYERFYAVAKASHPTHRGPRLGGLITDREADAQPPSREPRTGEPTSLDDLLDILTAIVREGLRPKASDDTISTTVTWVDARDLAERLIKRGVVLVGDPSPDPDLREVLSRIAMTANIALGRDADPDLRDLDVERLALALAAVGWHGTDARQQADAIAREYAALARQEASDG